MQSPQRNSLIGSASHSLPVEVPGRQTHRWYLPPSLPEPDRTGTSCLRQTNSILHVSLSSARLERCASAPSSALIESCVTPSDDFRRILEATTSLWWRRSRRPVRTAHRVVVIGQGTKAAIPARRPGSTDFPRYAARRQLTRLGRKSRLAKSRARSSFTRGSRPRKISSLPGYCSCSAATSCSP